jgi:hypothetical protein
MASLDDVDDLPSGEFVAGEFAAEDFDQDAFLDESAFLDDAYGGREEPSPIRRFEASAAGVVSAAWMNGLRNGLFGAPKQEVTVVTDWNGDPPFKDPYVLRLDPEHPEDSIVMVRPWLRNGEVAGAEDPDAR